MTKEILNGQVSTTELAKMLGISRVAIQKKIDAGDILAKKVGRGYVIELSELPDDLKQRIIEEREKTTEKVTKKSQKKDSELDFEKELWEAADKLRGSVDASAYKHIVLGMLFLKYVSDAFYSRREELAKWTADSKNEDYYIPDEKSRDIILDNKDYYTSAGVFFVPKKARWEFLRANASQDNLGEVLDEAMEAIEKDNPKELKGVLPKVYTRSQLDKHVLGELITIFSKIDFDHNFDKEKDMLGRVYEYFLGQFASAEGKRGGEFYTPRSLVQLLVEVLEPFENARIFDPSCGSGGMFVQSSYFLRDHDKDASRIAVYGQESNPTTLRLCKMNLAIRGIFGQVEHGNSYYDDKFPDLRADFVLANPPFNADWDPKRISDSDPRAKYGLAPKTNANFMWMQHFTHHLAPNGMAGFVMANGALAVGGKTEGKIREKMIKDDLVDIIIACPAKLFYNVALPVSLWFMSKNKAGDRFRKRDGEVLFIDARDEYETVSRKQVTFSPENMKKILDTVHAWRGEHGAPEYADIPGFCKSATLDEIADNGYVLTPGRYVGIADEEEDDEPFAQKMERLEKELKGYFFEGEKLEKQILENLKKIKK